MDPETEFDTDMMILDYTCCKATYELLLSRIAELSDKPPREGTNLLSIFNTWRALISTKPNNTRQISRDIKAKLQLITFTELFISRARQSKWTRDNNNINQLSSSCNNGSTRSSPPPSFSSTYYTIMLDILKIPPKDRLEKRENVVSLMDLAPEWATLCSAMANAAALSTSSLLSDLTGKWLLQAVLEQYTIFGRTAADAKDDGLAMAETIYHRRHREEEEKEEGGGGEKWLDQESISQYLNLLSPPSNRKGGGETSLEDHFNQLILRFPTLHQFESMIVMQLHDFLLSLDTPVLVKVETGELDFY